jgi:hypothetical protein
MSSEMVEMLNLHLSFLFQSVSDLEGSGIEETLRRNNAKYHQNWVIARKGKEESS